MKLIAYEGCQFSVNEPQAPSMIVYGGASASESKVSGRHYFSAMTPKFPKDPFFRDVQMILLQF